MSKILILVGLLIVIIGLLWPYLKKIGIGRLPGDIYVQGDNYNFYFPLMTCIIISLILSAIIWLISRF